MQPPDEVLITEYQTLAEFRYQLRRFLRFSEQTARTAGLEPQQHQLLLAVKGLPQGMKATIGTLAERLQLAHHSTVELIDRLVERGFVQRCRDEADQRRVLVNLTPQGEEMLRKLSLAHQTELRSVGSVLVQALNTLLRDRNN
ncbi:MAG TPA: MarR family transcriptional regulator [Ktedonobacteraceae bacterium]